MDEDIDKVEVMRHHRYSRMFHVTVWDVVVGNLDRCDSSHIVSTTSTYRLPTRHNKLF